MGSINSGPSFRTCLTFLSMWPLGAHWEGGANEFGKAAFIDQIGGFSHIHPPGFALVWLPKISSDLAQTHEWATLV